MKLKVVVHQAEESGHWGEVPALPGCASQGETLEALLANMREAIEGCLMVDIGPTSPDARVLENRHLIRISVEHLRMRVFNPSGREWELRKDCRTTE